MLPCFLHMPRGVLWPLNTMFVVSTVRDVSVRLWLLLEGVSTLFGTLALFLAHLVPTLLIRAGGGKSICIYPNLLPSFGY
jgi:hypothetical protein